MNKIREMWGRLNALYSSNKSTAEMVLLVITLVCSIAVIVLAGLQIFGVMPNAVFIYMPLMGVIMLVQALNMSLSGHRGIAIFSLCVAVFLFLVTIFRVIIAVVSCA